MHFSNDPGKNNDQDDSILSQGEKKDVESKPSLLPEPNLIKKEEPFNNDPEKTNNWDDSILSQEEKKDVENKLPSIGQDRLPKDNKDILDPVNFVIKNNLLHEWMIESRQPQLADCPFVPISLLILDSNSHYQLTNYLEKNKIQHYCLKQDTVQSNSGWYAIYFPFLLYEIVALLSILKFSIDEQDVLEQYFQQAAKFLSKGGDLCMSNNKSNEFKLFFASSLDTIAYDQECQKQAKEFFEALSIKELPCVDFKNTNCKDPKEILRACYENNQGLILGEAHNCIAPKKFLIDNMSCLKKLGVNILFLENVCYHTLQPLLNRYYESPPNSEMDPFLEEVLKNVEKSLKNIRFNYANVVKVAKEEKIRVVAIDLIKNKADNQWIVNDGDASRLTTLNFHGYQVIKRTMSQESASKFVVLCGAGHMTTMDDVHGFAQIGGYPCIYVSTGYGNAKMNVSKFTIGKQVLGPANCLFYIPEYKCSENTE